MTLMDIGAKPAGRGNITEEIMDQDMFLYDEHSGTVHQLNGGAAMIWLLCDGSRNLMGIAEEIASTGELSAIDVLPDVQETIAQFDNLGLLEESRA